MRCHHFAPAITRRAMLRASAGGFGHLVLSALGSRSAMAAPGPGPNASPLAARTPHFPARAKRIIFLFMWGGPSHVDLFDPKPRLNGDTGQPPSVRSVEST